MVLDERLRAELEAALAAAEADQEVRGHKRKKPTGRKPIPEHLPRVDIQILPPSGRTRATVMTSAASSNSTRSEP